jgi:hypothetical protein
MIAHDLVAQNLDDALLVELSDPLAELLEASGVADTDDGEVFRSEAWDRWIRDRLVDPQRITNSHIGGVHEPDDVAGKGLVDRLTFLAEHGVGVLGGKWLAGGSVGDHHAPLEPSAAHPYERDAIAMSRIHVCLHLEDEAAERRVEVARPSFRVGPRSGRRRQVDHTVE